MNQVDVQSSTHFTEQPRLRLPGPVHVHERVLQATARPIIAHRSPPTRALIQGITEKLKPLFGTQSPILLFASSGTGVMEASLVNTLGPGESVLVAIHGSFGERFAAIATALGADVDKIEAVPGQAPDVNLIKAKLEKKSYRALLVVHNESSTGIVCDIAALGALVKDSDTLLIVDSVSGVGGIEMRQDEWGADIVVSVTQKALMSPPGVGIATLSDKAMAVIERDDRLPRFYWDFRSALSMASKHETAYTPAVSLLQGLHEALLMIDEQGYQTVYDRHRLYADALRKGLVALGFQPFGDPGAYSDTVIVAIPPAPLLGTQILGHMRDHHNTFIAAGIGALRDRLIRIGNMGVLCKESVLMDLDQLEQTVTALGVTVAQPGAAVAQAKEVLRNE